MLQGRDGFWNSLKNSGLTGHSAGARLWARYWLCLWEKILGQAGAGSPKGRYPALLKDKIHPGMLLLLVGTFSCFDQRVQQLQRFAEGGRRNAVS